LTGGTYSDPPWLTAVAGSKVSGAISGAAATITGALALANTPLTARGDILVATTATPILGKLAKGTQYQTLQGGASDPGYDAVHLDQASAVTGVLPMANLAAQVPVCTAYTVAHTNAAFIVASATATVTLATIPASGQITGLRIKHSVAFAGTAVTSATVSLGDGTTVNIYAAACDVFVAPGDTVLRDDGGAFATTAASHSLAATFTANTNWGDGGATVLTAGSVVVHACVRTLP
jgi:hypothetical protein